MPKLSIDIEARLAQFEGSINKMESTVTGAAAAMQAAFGAIGAGLSVGALTQFVKGAIDAADEVGKLSQKVGVAVESLSELQYAGKLADVSTEALGDGLRKLNVNLQEAATGNKELRAAFAAVGISANELKNIKADDALKRIADAFADAEDGAGKTALAVKLLGRAGSDFIPLLNAGSAGLRDAGEEARRFGVVVGADAAKAAEQFNDNLTRLSETARGVGQSIAAVIVGPLAQLSEQMLESQRIFGGFFSALYNVGVGIDPFKSLGENLSKYRAEVERLTKLLANPDIKGTKLAASLQDSLDAATKRLEFLKFQQRQAIQGGDGNADARDLALRGGPRRQIALPDAGSGAGSGRSTKGRSVSDALTEEERIAIDYQKNLDREFEKRLDDAARARKEMADDYLKAMQDGNETDRRVGEEQKRRVEQIIGETVSGKLEALRGQSRELVELLNANAIDVDQYDEALERIRQKMAEVALSGDENFKKLKNTLEDDIAGTAFQRLEMAVRGWGDATTDVIVEMVKTGKLEFGSLVQTVLSDLLKLMVYKNITGPIFGALSGQAGSLAGLFGFGKGSGGTPSYGIGPGAGQGLRLKAAANGGPVSGGSTILVGERGPEIFVPNVSGKILPNGYGGGGQTLVVNINAPTDGAVIRAAVMQAVALSQSSMGRAARIGAMS